MRYCLFITLIFTVFTIQAQQQVTVGLTQLAKEDRFDRLNLNMALFELNNDTILSWDYEGLYEAKAQVVIKPAGFKKYAYGYVFFAGNGNPNSPGMVSFLVTNPYDKQPGIYFDVNNNLDFTDDIRQTLPWRNDSLVTQLCLPQSNACIHFKLTRHPFNAKHDYKTIMNEFYATTYPNRTFLGMEHCYRIQYYQTKCGVLNVDNDSFFVALFDGNQNGKYNEADSDRFVVAQYTDTVFYPFDDLHGTLLNKKVAETFLDVNGKQINVTSVEADGSKIGLEISGQGNSTGQIKPGKKLPKFTFTNYKGQKQKIRKWNKYGLYIYYGSPKDPGFTTDTIALRKLVDEFGSTIKVIGFIEVNKSYELSIFGQYSYVNWHLAYKNKYTNQALGFRGIPSSVYTRKRRRVVQYNIRPEQLWQQLKNTSKQ